MTNEFSQSVFEKHSNKLTILGILAIGLMAFVTLVALRPTAPKTQRAEQAALVHVVNATTSSERVRILGQGEVEAKQSLDVFPQVSGHIVEVNPQTTLGGLLASDQLLARIDPRDYQIQLEVERAALSSAEVELKLERANQVVAKREWDLLGDSVQTNKLGKQLALREPQLRQRAAALEAAKSRVKRAELDLERTELKSPFSSIVVEEEVEIGKFVNPQTRIARIVATDGFHIQARFANRDLKWLSALGGKKLQAAKVTVIQDLGDGKSLRREGKVVRILGDVDTRGRMPKVLIEVVDPLNRQAQQEHPPLLLGAYVQVEIAGPELNEVFRFNREVLREGSRVWIVDEENRLQYRQVEVLFSDEQEIVLRGDLNSGDRIISSPLQLALRGMLIEVLEKEDTASLQLAQNQGDVS